MIPRAGRDAVRDNGSIPPSRDDGCHTPWGGGGGVDCDQMMFTPPPPGVGRTPHNSNLNSSIPN